MFEVLSERITEWLLANKTIPREDKEIYRYGIQQGLFTLLNFGTTVIIGLVFGLLWESMLFMTAYIPLRSYAGGYHAKTAVRCYFFSIVMMSTVLWVMGHVMYSGLVCGSLTAISAGLIWFLVPVEDKNKPLDDTEKVVYRRRARKIVLTESILSFWAVVCHREFLGMCMTLVLCVMVLMLLLGKRKNAGIGKRG